MKSLAGKLFWVAISLLVLGVNVSEGWDRFVSEHPGASGWDFARASVPYLGLVVLGIAGVLVVTMLVKLIAKPVARWTAPSRSAPPPSDAGPPYALRTYPLHVAVCLGLIAASLLAFYLWPTAAMVLTGLTIGAWVMLARRMGFEPSNDPAAPQNQSRT